MKFAHLFFFRTTCFAGDTSIYVTILLLTHNYNTHINNNNYLTISHYSIQMISVSYHTRLHFLLKFLIDSGSRFFWLRLFQWQVYRGKAVRIFSGGWFHGLHWSGIFYWSPLLSWTICIPADVYRTVFTSANDLFTDMSWIPYICYLSPSVIISNQSWSLFKHRLIIHIRYCIYFQYVTVMFSNITLEIF